MAAHSLSLLSTASWASTRRWVDAHADARLIDFTPAPASPLRRTVFCHQAGDEIRGIQAQAGDEAGFEKHRIDAVQHHLEPVRLGPPRRGLG